MNIQFSFNRIFSDYHEKLLNLPLGLRQTAFMFVATSIGSALNYLVHFATSRMLGPTGYGIFASLNSFYMLIATPLGILPMVIAHYLAQFQARGEIYRARALLTDMLKWVALIGALASAAIALASPFLANFLQIPSQAPILIVAGMVFLGALMPVLTGALQGLQKFLALGMNGIVGAVLRLAFAVGLVALGLGASGALGAQILAGMVTFAIAMVSLAPVLSLSSSTDHSDHGLALKDVLGYGGLVLVGTTCFAALTNMDVMIVKHYFSPAVAGQYAAASVLAKIILFFPGAITAVLFPKAAKRHALRLDSSGIARQAAAAVVGLCGGLAVVYFLIPGLLIRLLFGQGYETAVPLVGFFGVTMALFALVNLQMTYYLSIHKTSYVPLLAGSTLVQVAALALFHNSLIEVILIQLVNISVLLVVGEVVCRGIIGDKERNGISL
jgi:O-antigen/teichoic acid export membrane protein